MENNDLGEVKRKCTYTITHTEYYSGKTILERENDGFNIYELLGVLDLASRELVQQLKGEIKADVIERTAIKTNKVIK